jgi:hypothetical protein
MRYDLSNDEWATTRPMFAEAAKSAARTDTSEGRRDRPLRMLSWPTERIIRRGADGDEIGLNLAWIRRRRLIYHWTFVVGGM